MTSFLQTNGNCVSVLPDIRVDPHRSSSPSVIQQQQLIKNGSPYSEQHITIVAIEGGIAVGKSTLKNKLATVLQATLGPTCLVVHVD
jgi:pantothenate kinase